jgi:hypothetical protein
VPCDESATELTLDTPMPGIDPPTVLAQLLRKGFCALDVHGIVHSLQAYGETVRTEPRS